VKICGDAQLDCWFKLDQTFHLPKANVYIQILTNKAYDRCVCVWCVCVPPPPPALSFFSAVTNVLTELFTAYLDDALTDYSYMASEAGLHYSLHRNRNGIQMRVVGYSEKLPLFLQRILTEMRTVELNSDVFSRVKEKVRGVRVGVRVMCVYVYVCVLVFVYVCVWSYVCV